MYKLSSSIITLIMIAAKHDHSQLVLSITNAPIQWAQSCRLFEHTVLVDAMLGSGTHLCGWPRSHWSLHHSVGSLVIVCSRCRLRFCWCHFDWAGIELGSCQKVESNGSARRWIEWVLSCVLPFALSVINSIWSELSSVNPYLPNLYSMPCAVSRLVMPCSPQYCSISLSRSRLRILGLSILMLTPRLPYAS